MADQDLTTVWRILHLIREMKDQKGKLGETIDTLTDQLHKLVVIDGALDEKRMVNEERGEGNDEES